jgi:HK97 family phage major capsid protein
VLESGVRVIATDRSQVQWPRMTADMTAAFYNELDPITESDPTFDSITVVPKAIKCLVRGSAEAFEDSSPDLLQLLQAHVEKILALKLDRALLFGLTTDDGGKSFQGMDASAGGTVAWGSLVGYDAFQHAVGQLGGNYVPGPYAIVMHPYAATALSLTKKFTGTITSNENLDVPDGFPPVYVSGQIPLTGTTPNFLSNAYVYAPASVGFVRRRDITVEVDRSQEFTSDSVLVRGKLRGAPVFPYPKAVCKITSVPSTLP